ncbi:MAG TPA: 4Fe-4S binding protein [Thermoleophilia bacterium]|nr:4Fe-4S binding protein [Thermoleophilia bacterium]
MPEMQKKGEGAPTAADARLRALAAAVGAPDFMIPWLDRFYEPAEVDLVLGAAEGRLPGARAADELQRAVRRAVLDRNGERWSPSSFHARYEMWAFFEHWRDIPQSVRDQLNEWEMDDYLDEVGPGIAAIRDGRPAESDQRDNTYLLLEEAEALLLSRPAIYLWPCNCRAMMGRCDHSQTVCLRFENDRDIGWEITPERAVQILHQADAEGLMHTGYLESTHGHHGICNCCSDCCFPILAGERMDAAALWPVRRHLAAVDAERCTRCRRCVRRCPFGALSLVKKAPAPTVDPTVCRGCGLCATGCEEEAITMAPREAAWQAG